MARSFNGSSDYIALGSFNYDTNTTGTFSIWADISALPVAYSNFFDLGASTSYVEFYLKSTGNVAIYIGNMQYGFNISSDPVPSGPTLSTGTWYHLLFTIVQSGGVNLYLNGSANGSFATDSGTGSSHSITGAIGQDLRSAGRFFNGNLAHFAFWNVVLSAGEIAALAKGALPFQIRPTALMTWLPLDGIASPEPDLSAGNANNGTLTGTALAAGPPLQMFSPRVPRFETFTPPIVAGLPTLGRVGV